MKSLSDFRDIHTHRADAGEDALICVEPEAPRCPGRWYSVGVHPWTLGPQGLTDAQRVALEAAAADSRVAAIGEAGIDLLRGPAVEVQTEAFMEQAEIAAAAGKPLIIHCVRAWHIVLRLRAEFLSAQAGAAEPQWVIHGFRGGPALARQLLDAGFDLSFGVRCNAASFALTPPDRRFRESDALA